MSQTKKEVSIKYRDVRIAYEVDGKSIADLATTYDIEWPDMKKALMDYGITIRRNGEVRTASEKDYVVVLADKDKIKADTKIEAVQV